MTRRAALARLGAMTAAGAAGCIGVDPAPSPPSPPPPSAAFRPPPAPREFRGAWVASVANIDWPSRPALPVPVQQEEVRSLVRTARSIGLNALILQVRPAADALYASPLEPWSEYLTGAQGRPPQPYYDPLAFWIEEAHAAGLELHAWFNPFRARHSSARGPLSATHVGVARADLVKAYGDLLWMDPGEPDAASRALAVILDVVTRYDIDGIHVDDYFYPYPVKSADGREVDFPDDNSYRAYVAGGGRLDRATWRRANVDAFIERLFHAVRQQNDRLRIGISPFGIGRPDRRPPGVSGFSQYDAIYADVERWLEKGWMDYLAPQLYWKIDSPAQPFAPLLAYWQAQNPRARDIWPGLFTSRIDSSEASWMPDEIARQVVLARAGGANGHIHFSMAALAQDRRGIAGVLRALYGGPALVPARNEKREAPGNPWLVATWAHYADRWRFFVLPGNTGNVPEMTEGRALDALFVSNVDRFGVEGPWVRAR